MKYLIPQLKLATALFLLFVMSACKKTHQGTPENEKLGDPVIKFYDPSSGNVGDTIWIEGKNFSKTAANNTVTFHSVEVKAIQSKINSGIVYDSIQVVVPKGASDDVLRVSVLTKSVVAKDTFWITTGKWVKRASLPSGGRFSGTAFGLGNKGYIAVGYGYGGENNFILKDLWEFDPDRNQWSKKADFPIGGLMECTSFVIDKVAYVGFGSHAYGNQDNRTLYAYDPGKNIWMQKASTSIGASANLVGLSAGGKGYAITGEFTKQFFMFDPIKNQWIIEPDFPGGGRTLASGFVINDELYFGAGDSGHSLQYADLWKYSPATEKWTQLASAFFGGAPAVGFSINGKGYRMLPRSAGYTDSGVYEYDPVINAWTRKKRFPGIAEGSQMGFVVNGRAFVTGGLITNGYSDETWELIP